MPTADVQTGLQGVVNGVGRRPSPVQIEEIGEVSWDPITAYPVGQIGGRDRCLAGLVDIQELKQLGPLRSRIPDLEYGFVAQWLLNVQVEILSVGSAQIRIGSQEVAIWAETAVNRLCRIQGSAAYASELQSHRTRSRVSWPRAEDAIPGQVSQENILRECVIEQAPPAADYGPAFAGHVVGESDAGAKLL